MDELKIGKFFKICYPIFTFPIESVFYAVPQAKKSLVQLLFFAVVGRLRTKELRNTNVQSFPTRVFLHFTRDVNGQRLIDKLFFCETLDNVDCLPVPISNWRYEVTLALPTELYRTLKITQQPK